MKAYVLVDFATEDCELLKDVISIKQNAVIEGKRFILVEKQVHPELVKNLAFDKERYCLLPIRRSTNG